MNEAKIFPVVLLPGGKHVMVPLCRIAGSRMCSVRLLLPLALSCMTPNITPGNCRSDPLNPISSPLKNHLTDEVAGVSASGTN